MSSLSRTLLACSGLLLSFAASVSAGPMYINAGDGSLADWGVTLNSSDHLQFNFGGATSALNYTTNSPQTGVGTMASGAFSFNYYIEDQKDGDNGHSLGPHAGGQNYDAEFMGTGLDNGYLVIAIATGQRSDNGQTYFAPGDIKIETSNGTFGVEVGGGGSSGETYTLNSNGYTVSPYTLSNPYSAGEVLNDTTWSQSPTTPHTDTQLTNGTHAGDAETFLYSFLSGSQHAFIELAIPVSIFDPGTMLNSVRWAPGCNNDFVMTTFDTPIPMNQMTPAPEPTSLSLLLIGGLGLCGYRRRRFA